MRLLVENKVLMQNKQLVVILIAMQKLCLLIHLEVYSKLLQMEELNME